MKQHYKLLIALGAGALLGVTLHPLADQNWIQQIAQNLLAPLGQLFLRSIFMIVVPMVFAGLVLGVFELGQHLGLKRVISKTLLFTVISSTASVLIGVVLINLFKPGTHVSIPTDTSTVAVEGIAQNAKVAKPFVQGLIEVVPKNPLEAAVKALDGEMLSLMFFALVFGLALSRVVKDSDGKGSVIKFLEDVYAACLLIVDYVMKYAPIAVFALVFTSTFKFGYELLVSLAYYVAVVVGALLIQQFVVYGLMLKVFSKRSPM